MKINLIKIDESLGYKMIDEALKAGASAAEVYIRKKRGISTESRGGSLESVKSSHDFGYALRLIKDQRMGFSFSTRPEDLHETVKRAIEASMFTERDINHKLPLPSANFENPAIFDQEVADTGPEDAFERAFRMEQAAIKSDKRIRQVRSAIASFSTEEVVILNSHKMDEGYVSTSAGAQIMAVAEEGGESQMGFDFEGSSFLQDIEYERVGSNAAKKALMMLGAKKITPFKGNLVLENSIAAEFLAVFASMLSADAVQKGKSLLKGKLGADIINPMLDIIDDPLMGRTLGSRPFDDEGVPTRKRSLVKDGILEGFMYNTYTAQKEGIVSTGNAVKAGLSTPPGIGPLSMYLATARTARAKLLNELYAGAGKGLYVLEAMGMHTANPISGDFSIGVAGILIENGKLSHPVKEAVISGNILDMFKKVQAIGDDLKFFGSIGSPTILLGPIDISA